MLLLGRHVGESIMIGDDVEVKVIAIRGGVATIGVQAPKEVAVHREEVYERIQNEGEKK